MSDIVERLRHCSENCGDEYLRELTGKAADTITRLTAEVEREKAYGTTMHAEWEKQREESARVKAENERLWEAKRGTDNVTSRLTAEVERLRAALLVARKYVLVQSCELSLQPDDAARDLDFIDEALEEDDDQA